MPEIEGNTVRERFLSAVRARITKFPNAVIAKETGYSKAIVSEYLNDGEPSENFLRTFCQKFNIDFNLIWEGIPNTEGYQAKYEKLAERYMDLSDRYNKLIEVSLVGLKAGVKSNQKLIENLYKEVKVELPAAQAPAVYNHQDQTAMSKPLDGQ